jgi:hypothetical protein
VKSPIQGHSGIFCRISHVTLIKKPTFRLAFFLENSKRKSVPVTQILKEHPVYLYIQISLMRDLTFSGGIAHLSWALHACFRHLSSNISSVLARMVKSQSDLKSLQLSSLYASCLSAMVLTSFPCLIKI